MRLHLPSSASGILAGGLLLLGWCATPCIAQCHRCNSCPGGVSGEFFGYYPTSWRPWPAVTIIPTREAIPAPSNPAAPMPTGPTMQPAPAPKPVEKPLEQTSFPKLDGPGSNAEPQPYFAPPQ